MSSVVLSLSRILISALFLVQAFKHIFLWDETEKGFIDRITQWQTQLSSFQDLQPLFAFLISYSSLFLLFGTVGILMGGIFVLTGFKEKMGLFLLAFFLIPSTFLYHPFWWFDGFVYQAEGAMFMKNLAIVGCLLRLLSHGRGSHKLSNASFESVE